MASSILPAATGAPQQEPPLPIIVPPLENGDRLTRAEFERRYEAMPQVHKAELIEGEVHMPSPVRIKHHARPHRDLSALLAIYSHFTPGVGGGDNPSVRLDNDNEPQPDDVLYIEPECGGNIRIDDDDIINGAPELAAEVSSSTVSIDVGKKLQVYRRNKVQEYIVWRVLDRAIDWFYWKDGNYERMPATADGVVTSVVFPGLWLDLPAIVRGDFARAHAVLQQGLQSREHAEFVAKLEAARQKK
jgi:Uma2 family endonuclease